MSNDSQNTPNSNHKIFNWFISKGAAITDCLLKAPSLIIQAGKALFHIENHLASIWHNSKEIVQTISEDFKEFLQVAQNQNRTEEELTMVQEKLAHDIAQCLRQNVDIVCQILTIGIVLFDCTTELKELLYKSKSSLQEMYQESKDATTTGANKAIKYVTEFFQHRQTNLPTVSGGANYQIEFSETPNISLRIIEGGEDKTIESMPVTEISCYDCETTGQNASQNSYPHD